MSDKLHILEPWSVLLSAEFLSFDVTTGNLRVRVAGGERTYLGTSFRFIDVKLPLRHIMALGMPGGAIRIAKALPDWPDVPLGEPSSESATDMHAEDVSEAEIHMAKGSSKGGSPPNAPSKTGNPSGGGRGNNPPKGK